ncbi:unnamed protein product [Phytophthora fragariaefolia]|uniref:Unnamed protein product n=1 Tax=Phytophthora fragariaefolia TaxID=1490495 RepID=A0A9W6XGH3_9STRA|nr:unnamed protein product [Phytophthora fragariaefolia]
MTVTPTPKKTHGSHQKLQDESSNTDQSTTWNFIHMALPAFSSCISPIKCRHASVTEHQAVATNFHLAWSTGLGRTGTRAGAKRVAAAGAAGVEVDLPTDLAGIHFEFTAGTLTIHCQNFTGDVVLSKPTGKASRPKQQAAGSPSKKRTIDLSASDDDDDEADAKRVRPNFLNEAEQTLLLAQLDAPQNSKGSQKVRGKAKKAKSERKADVAADASTTDANSELSADSASEVVPATDGKVGKKTPTKKNKKKATTPAKGAVNSFFLQEPKQSTPHKSTLDSNKKRTRTPKSRSESSPSGSIMELMSGPPKPKQAGALFVFPDHQLIYGGSDDEEHTLGDLHVFDMKTHRWTTPLNCATITRAWHDAVFLASKNLVLVFGGERNAQAEGELDILSDIAVLDTECLLWYPPAIRGTPPSARSGHTCTAIGNDVVVFGGSRGRSRQSSVHILNTGEWLERYIQWFMHIMVTLLLSNIDDWNWKMVKVDGKPPSARTYHTAVAVGDDIVYFGGNDSSKSFNAVHVLKKSSKKSGDDFWSWFHPTALGTPPQARTGHSATLLDNGKILVFGGWDPQRDDANAPTTVFDDAFLLDSETWEWQPAVFTDEGKPNRGRVGHGAAIDSSGCVHLFGGQNTAEQRLDDICTISIVQKHEEQTTEAKDAIQSTSGDAATTNNLETSSV